MFKFCKKYICEYKAKIISYLCLSMIATGLAIIIPILWGKIIDIMVIKSDINSIVKIGIIISVVGVVKIIINYYNNKLYIIIQTNLAMDISADLINHLHKISLTKFQEYDAGYLNESINHDSNSVTIFFLSVLTGILSNILLLIIPLSIMFNLTHKMVIVLLAVITGYIVLYISFREKLMEKARIFQDAQSKFFSAIVEQFKNVKFIKQHALEEYYKVRFRKSFQVFFEKALSTQQFLSLYSSLDQMLEVIINFCIYIIGGILVIKGELTIGSFTIILNYYRSILVSIKYFADLGKEYQKNNVAYQRLQSYFDLKVQRNGKEEINKVTQIKCNNLSFSRGDNEIIRSFNATFDKGNIYCICGENGTGKTTLLDLLTGLYIDEYKGEILYNNVNLKDIDMKKQRAVNISMIEQNPYVFEGTIEENIYLTKSYSNKKYSHRVLDKKLGNIYNNGDGISGGEKQKIGILRMLSKDSDVVMLDEPTSALDQESKKRVLEILKEIKKEKIIILISHDKEVEKFADYVINMSSK